MQGLKSADRSEINFFVGPVFASFKSTLDARKGLHACMQMGDTVVPRKKLLPTVLRMTDYVLHVLTWTIYCSGALLTVLVLMNPIKSVV